MSARVDSMEAVRDMIADEIADAGAGCIARVARTASTPLAWRMVAVDVWRWSHPACPREWSQDLARAAKAMERGDYVDALAGLDAATGEGTVFVALGVEPEAQGGEVSP